jgi:hypothetical protein
MLQCLSSKARLDILKSRIYVPEGYDLCVCIVPVRLADTRRLWLIHWSLPTGPCITLVSTPALAFKQTFYLVSEPSSTHVHCVTRLSLPSNAHIALRSHFRLLTNSYKYFFTFGCCILLRIYPTGSSWRRQSQQSFNTLTRFYFLSHSLHVSVPTGHPQVRYTIRYLKDYF